MSFHRDKVVKFADKERHQIYLEPEGRDTDEIYVNGLSTSLPQHIQEAVIRSIRGLERAEIVRLGYAIEYDCFPPTQLRHSLETKKIENLFLAGQINCTSGYEEAAAQGLMAGLNAIRKLKGDGPFVLERSEAYIGVLIDDLVTRGTAEPYRLFTSRAEYRLLLRQDNADERLMKHGHSFGLISADVYARSQDSYNRIRAQREILKKTWRDGSTLETQLKRPGVEYKSFIINKLCSCTLSDEDQTRLETEVKYEGYILRQEADIKRSQKVEKRLIPDLFDYKLVRGVSREAAEKLQKIRPASLGQASRIPGITPCDLALLAVHVEKHMRASQAGI